ncbi:MAG: flagellar hook-length control protein FliK [Lachnospiraceae bacterium]|nr:flagellar hook-length control protein FliK [Lachnospiraceae bacterium]
MQIDDIRSIQAGAMMHDHRPDFRVSTDNGETSDRSISPELRSISIKNPTYQKDDLESGGDLFDQAMRDSGSGASAAELKNRMVLASEDMTDEEFALLKDEDHSPMDMEADEYRTLADDIRAQMERGGADMAMTKAAQLGELRESGMMYLLKNDLEPTIDNVFSAEFSQGGGMQATTNIKRDDISVDVRAYEESAIDLRAPEMEGMLTQVEGVITEAGYEVTDELIAEAQKLIGNDIPVTPENIDYFDRLNHEPLMLDEAQLTQAIDDAVTEGRSPGQAYLLPGYSLHDQARKLYDEVQSMTVDASDVTAARQLNEARLLMTFEASYTMVKAGVEVDTSDLSRLVDDLRLIEDQLTQRADVRRVVDTVNEVREMPVSILGDFADRIDTVTISLLFEAGKNAAESRMNDDATITPDSGNDFERRFFEAAGRYETMATEVRRDLGDSIKKAFRNVDDILSEIGMEENVANERAVRILGYNSLEITPESVTQMKYADEKVQQTLSSLTPGVVTELIRRGENPLDMSLEKLDETVNKIKEEIPAVSTTEKFSEFLWKMDQTGEMTEEQRDSFIGVYRLIHQVEKTDGAIIGQLMAAGMEPTLRNMMTAVRTRKNEGREYTVDDDFGGINAVDVGKLSITEQIEAGFMYSRLKDAGNEMTPNLMMQFDSKDTYMNMNPDQFASALEEMDQTADEKLDEAYAKEQVTRLQQAVATEERIYQILNDMDAPLTPSNLEAWTAFMADKNGAFRFMNRAMYDREGKAFSQVTSDLDIDDPEGALSDVMADIIEAFGESAKTPEEMAEAQEKLAETAENVMRDFLVEKETGRIDVRGMRIAMKQLTLMGHAARQTEQYAVPILVADELGNMNLKIVRGEDEDKGQVDIALDLDKMGSVSASFKLNGDVFDGHIRVVTEAARDAISDNLQNFSDKLSSAAGFPVGLTVGLDESVDSNSIFTDRPDYETTSERREIQTKKLYAMARAFIQGFGEIIS